MHDLYRQNQALDLPALEAILKQVFDHPGSPPTQKCVRLILQSAEAFALDKRMHDSITRRKIGGRPFSPSAKGFSHKERRSFYSQLEQAITNLIELMSPLILLNEGPIDQYREFKTGRGTTLTFSSKLSIPVIKWLCLNNTRIKSRATYAFIGLTVSCLHTLRAAVAAARQEIRTTRGAQPRDKELLSQLDEGLISAFYTAFGSMPPITMNSPFFLSLKITYGALNICIDEESLLNRAKKARKRLRPLTSKLEKQSGSRQITALFELR